MSKQDFRQAVQRAIDQNQDVSSGDQALVLQKLARRLESTRNAAPETGGLTVSTEGAGRSVDGGD